ncbi:hypothetical protein DRN72_02670 [Methanosarcinales archaeon]|nr:MAG: hypothetical protein DRN72_02670 [Methanosarcinales archaeon]
MKLSRFVVMMLLILLLVPCSGALIEESEFKHVKLPAVYTSPEGEEGVLTELLVYTTKGNGYVFVDTYPFTQVDMQGSARLAAIVACDVLGLNYQDYDFYYVLKVDTPIVGGPSGGAAMTVATIASLLNLSLRDDVVMTGMINPDGSIGPVGGIPSKLEASAKSGANVFLIPKGQRVVQVVERVEEKQGPFILISERTKNVDVVELGNKLGVEVMEVGDIRDAVEIFTGYKIPEKKYNGTVITTQYQNMMKPLAEMLLNEVDARYEEVGSIAVSSLQNDLESQKELINRSRTLYGEGYYYASTSLSFNILINLREIEYTSNYMKSSNRNEYLMNLQAEVSSLITQIENEVNQEKENAAVLNIEGVGASESRLQEANSLFEAARTSKSPQDQIKLLSYAYERARSAKWWIRLAQTSGVENFTESELRGFAGEYLSQAQSIEAYSETLVDESGAVGLRPYLLSANKEIEDAKTEFKNGYYAGAIYDSLYSIVYSSLAIELIGAGDVNSKLERYKEEAKNSIIEARNIGIEPILAASAYEHGSVLAEGDIEKLVDYGYARLSAKTTIMILSQLEYTNFTSAQNIEELFTTETHQQPEKSEHPQSPFGMMVVAIIVLILVRKIV